MHHLQERFAAANRTQRPSYVKSITETPTTVERNSNTFRTPTVQGSEKLREKGSVISNRVFCYTLLKGPTYVLPCVVFRVPGHR